jgi:transcriptional regulator with XRE-family HTH domain
VNKDIDKKTINPIARRLKQARQVTGISQKNLGIAAGIDEFSASPRMNQYETGKHTPDYSILARIAKALNLPIAYFYTEDDILAEIIKLYGSLSKTDQHKLLIAIKKL